MSGFTKKINIQLLLPQSIRKMFGGLQETLHKFPQKINVEPLNTVKQPGGSKDVLYNIPQGLKDVLNQFIYETPDKKELDFEETKLSKVVGEKTVKDEEKPKTLKDELFQALDEFKYSFNLKNDMTVEDKEGYKRAVSEGRGREFLEELKFNREALWKKQLDEAISDKYEKLSLAHTDKEGNLDVEALKKEFGEFLDEVQKLDPKEALEKVAKDAKMRLVDDLNFKKIKFDKIKHSLEKGKEIFEKGFASFNSVLSKIGIDFSSVLGVFSNAIKDAVDEIKEMTSFNSSSRYSSLEKQEQMWELGASSDAEFFAMKKAMEKLNMSTDEFYMGGVNDERNRALQELMEIEKKKYEEMQQSGVLQKMEEAQQKWDDFQIQMRQTVIKFISENGQTIITVISGILNVLGGILSVINSIFSFFKDETLTDEQVNQEIDSILNQSTQNVKNNLVITNNMHSVNPGMTNRHQLEKSGNQTGMTIARAISY